MPGWHGPTSQTATLYEISFWLSHFCHFSSMEKYLGKRGRCTLFSVFRCDKKEIENSDLQPSFSRRMTTKKYFIQQLVHAALLGPGRASGARSSAALDAPLQTHWVRPYGLTQRRVPAARWMKFLFGRRISGTFQLERNIWGKEEDGNSFHISDAPRRKLKTRT